MFSKASQDALEQAILDLRRASEAESAEKMARDWASREGKAARPWLILGDVLLWRKKYVEASSAFETSLQIDPANTRGLDRLTTALSHLDQDSRIDGFLQAGSNAYFSKAPDEGNGRAIGECSTLTTRTLSKQLAAAIKRHDYSSAKTVVEALSARGDADATAYQRLALFEATVGHPNSAMDWVTRALLALEADGPNRDQLEALLRHQEMLAAEWGNAAADQNVESRKQARAVRPFKKSLPLILISQVQRSGGTLLTQLFDGHPQQLTHPYELKIGYPGKAFWLRVPKDGNRTNIVQWISSSWIRRSSIFGYRKESLKKNPILPFCFANDLFHQIVVDRLKDSGAMDSRRVLDAYFSAFFSSWLSNDFDPDRARFFVAFAPGLSSRSSEVERFFQAYPDGYLVLIVRDPCAWYASARRHHPAYVDLDFALHAWLQSAKAMPTLKQKYQRKVVVISYEDLVVDCEGTMRRLCDAIGLEFSNSLLVPTLGGRPAEADSSYVDSSFAGTVYVSSVDRYRSELSADEIAHIRDICWPAYQEALSCRD